MSGERTGRREQVERMTQYLIRNGADPDKAKKKAVKCAIKADKREGKK
jgi:hypothetical protein